MFTLLDVIREQVVHLSVCTAPPAPDLLSLHIFLQAREETGPEIDRRSQVCLSPRLLSLDRQGILRLLATSDLIIINVICGIRLGFLSTSARFFLRGRHARLLLVLGPRLPDA